MLSFLFVFLSIFSSLGASGNPTFSLPGAPRDPPGSLRRCFPDLDAVILRFLVDFCRFFDRFFRFLNQNFIVFLTPSLSDYPGSCFHKIKISAMLLKIFRLFLQLLAQTSISTGRLQATRGELIDR